VVIAILARIILSLRNPKDAFRYYASKRNLVVLPLTFLGYMAASLIIQGFVWESHAPFWVALLAGILPVGIVLVGVRAVRRSPPAR
jgi:hypothetical protein